MNGKNVKIFAAIISAVLIVCIISAAADDSALSSLLNVVTSGMQQTASAVFGGDVKKSYKELEQELESLEQENASLRSSLAEYYSVMRENDRLWKYYGLKKENPEFELLPASVIRRDPNDDFYSFTIDCGSSDGVSANDPVITENGIIGYVSETDYGTARVCTVLSPQTKIGALDSRTSDSGIITGNALYCDDNLTTLTAISDEYSIEVGDILVSSGLSGVYPENLVLGEVVQIQLDSYDATAMAVVRPYDDVRTVSDVAVLTGFTGKSEVKASTEGD